MPRPSVDGLRWTAPERLHVTLRFLGECDEAAAVAALGLVGSPPALVALGPTMQRLGRSVVMIPARGVDDLAATVTEATRHLGQPPPKRRFTGRMTVARFRRDPSPGQWPPEDLPTLDVSFTASEMTLVRVEPSGAYVNVGDLHRWMQVIGHDGRCTHSIRSGGGSQVWHSDSVSMNERVSR